MCLTPDIRGFKVFGTFSEEVTVSHSVFAFLRNGSKLLIERICSPRSKFLLLRVDSIWGGLCHPEK